MKFLLIGMLLLFMQSCAGLKKDAIVTINLSTKGNDISFDQTSIQIPVGKKAVLKFTNLAEMQSEIDHNIALIKLGKEAEVMKIIDDESYDFDDETDPFKNSDLLIGYTKILAPQNEASITFTPKTPGYYTYICLMPGHGNIMKMKGVIKVK